MIECPNLKKKGVIKIIANNSTRKEGIANVIEIKFKVDGVLKQDYVAGYVEIHANILEYPDGFKIPTDVPIITAAYPNKVWKGDVFKAIGIWRSSSIFGYQFETENMFLAAPESLEEIEHFFKRNIKDVKPETVIKLIDNFGIEIINVIKDNPNELLKIKGISKEQVNNINSQLPRILYFKEAKMKLGLLGFEPEEVKALLDNWKFSTIDRIENNPYLARDKSLAKFNSCDTAAYKLGINRNHPKRIRAGILEVLSRVVRNGHLFVSKNDIFAKLSKLLNDNDIYNEKTEIDINSDFNPALNFLSTTGKIKIIKDNLESDDIVYVRFYYDIENKIVEYLKEIMAQSQGIMTEQEASRFVKEEKLKGTKIGTEQENAIVMSLTNRISILSGRPGSGKTYTADLIIKAIRSFDCKSTISLAAPTGKAAKRITEMTGMEAKTIHRLIGLNSEKEHNIELIKIESDYLIIDESSMIDVYVFYSLLSCMTENTKLLIIGDVDQIPSVGPGLVLRNLIDSKIIATTMLTKVYRQAQYSQIIINAHNIIDGKSVLSEDESVGDFYFVAENDIDFIKAMTAKSSDMLLETDWDLSEIQILTTTRKGDLGAEEFNNLIQDRYNPQQKGKEEVSIGKGRIFRVNDRIIQMKNNYDLGIFNGEMGNIIDIKTGEIYEIQVDFGDKIIVYTPKTLAEIQLAYAITVHKSQGSEFNAVIMPIHKEQNNLNRSIIYTGLTRAKERMIFIGQKDAYFKGIKNDKNILRNSRIKEKLIALRHDENKEQLEIKRIERLVAIF